MLNPAKPNAVSAKLDGSGTGLTVMLSKATEPALALKSTDLMATEPGAQVATLKLQYALSVHPLVALAARLMLPSRPTPFKPEYTFTTVACAAE